MARKKKAGVSFPDSVRSILNAETPDEEAREALKGLGLEPTVLNAIHLGMSGKAAKGDPSAAKYLRETAEEQARQQMEPVRLDLSGCTDEELRALAQGGGGPAGP